MNVPERILNRHFGPHLLAFSLGLVGTIATQIMFLDGAIAASPRTSSPLPSSPLPSSTLPSTAATSVAPSNAEAPETSQHLKTGKKPDPSQETSRASRTNSRSTASAPQQAPTVYIRVRIAHHPNQIELATSTAASVTSAGGNHGTMQPMTRYRAQVNSQGIQLGGMQLQNGVMIDPGPEGFVLVNNRWYRGQLNLVYAEGELLAVNRIDLEQYLYSVVGSEMPASWHPDALRAQAVAARSYALTHIARPASPWFDLGDNERWQAYNGVESEAASTYAAVADTTAQVLTYEGQILEALYAATQAITDSAHGGFGMSQYGAADLANQGHNYQQILANYYPGAAIAHLSN